MFYWSLIFLNIAAAAGFGGFLSSQGMASETLKVIFILFLMMFVSLTAVGIERRFFLQRIGLLHRRTSAAVI